MSLLKLNMKQLEFMLDSYADEPEKILIDAIPKKIHSKIDGDTFRGSKFRGVSRNKNKWQMMIMINQNNIYLGGIKNDELAAKFYDKIAIISKGVNAQTNFAYKASQIEEILNEFDFDFTKKKRQTS
mgnify:CR=1 FL=1